MALYFEICDSETDSQKINRLVEEKKELTKVNEELTEQLSLYDVVKSDSELLPKRLSNRAYNNANAMRYEDFVKWWDEQV